MAKKLGPIDLVNNLEKVANEIVEDMAYEISFAVLKQYNHVIDMFYADYPPSGKKLSYRRTYSTYEAAHNHDDVSMGVSYVPGGFEAGVRISSENIKGEPYLGNMSTETVFLRTFQYGIHGYSRFGVMNPTPKMFMDDWWKSFKTGGSIKKIQDRCARTIFRKYGINYR